MIVPHIIQDKIIYNVQDKHEYNLIFLTEGTFLTVYDKLSFSISQDFRS